MALAGLVSASAHAGASAGTSDGIELGREDAVAMALQDSRAIEQALWSRESAQGRLSEVRRQSGPKLTWSARAARIGGQSYAQPRRQRRMAKAQHRAYQMGLTWNDADVSAYPSYENEFGNSVSLTMPIYTGGKLEAQREAAEYALNAADLAVERSRQEVRYAVNTAYNSALRSRDMVHVRQRAVELLREHMRQIQIQLDVGTVSYSDLLDTEVELLSAERDLTEERGSYENAVADLAHAVGLPAGTPIQLVDDISYRRYTVDPGECVDYALLYRPDSIANEYAVLRARADRDAAKAAYRPSVSATATESRTGEEWFQKNHNQTWSLGIGMEWNVFDNGVTAAQVEQAEAALGTAESKAEQLKEDIVLAVRKACTNLRTADQEIHEEEMAVRQAEEAFRLAKIRYIEGIDTNLAVMDAQEKLTRARARYYAAFYAYGDAKASLDRAMGIPVALDAPSYVTAQRAGKTPSKALEAAALEEDAVQPKGKVRPASTGRTELLPMERRDSPVQEGSHEKAPNEWQ